MKLRFDGEAALVTGAGSGLGRAYALALSARGAHVAVNGIDERIDAVVAEIISAGGRATAVKGAVHENAAEIVNVAVSVLGRLDIVVSNAGVTDGGAFPSIPAEAFEKLLDVHIGGTVGVSRAAWPHLVSSGSGRLLLTSSSSVFGAAFTSSYGGAKGAIFAFTRAWAQEAQALCQNLRVNCVMPSAYTSMTSQIPDPAMVALLRDHFPAERVAGFVTWLLHRNTSISGETFQVGGNRAARVILAQARGVIASEDPDSWIECEERLMSLDGLSTPTSMIDEVAFQADCIGGAVEHSFAAVNIGKNWAG